jgi:putative PEP-CTERM system TPR-repeat lipoprotein
MNHHGFAGHSSSGPVFRGLQHAAGIGAVVVGLAFTIAGCDSAELSADAHVARAEKAIAAGDLPTSVIELKNAIQRNPENPQTRLRLGTTYLALGDPVSAEKEILRARELGAAAQDVLVPLAQAWNDQGAYERTLKEVVLDDTASEQHRTNALVARGLAHLGLGQPQVAQTHLDEALVITPDDASALVARARLAMQQEDLEKAALLVDRAHAVAPEEVKVVEAKGSLALAAGRPADAVAAFETLAARVPANFNYKMSLAQALIANSQADAALKTLDAMIRRAPKDPHVNYLAALAAYQMENFSAAKAYGQTVLDVAPDHLATLLIVGGAHFGLGENEQAVFHLSSFVRRVPQHEPARRVLGQALLRAGDPAGAQRVLQPLVHDKGVGDAALLAMIGTAALRSGDLESSKTYFQWLAESQPENAAARAQLGVVRLDLGEIEEGIADLETSVAQDPSSGTLALLATSYMRMGLLDKAMEAAQKLTHEHPESAVGPTLAGVIHVWRNAPDQARAAFQKARALDPDEPSVGFNLATLDFNEGNLEAAHQVLLETLQRNPRNPRVLQRLGELEAVMERPEAKARISEWMALEPKNIQPKVLLAQLHLQAQEPQKALDLTQRLREADPGNIQLGSVVGRAYLALERPNEAARVFRALSEAHPDAVAPRLALAQALVTAGEQEQAKEQLEKVHKIDPKNVPAKLALARLAIADGDVAYAKRMLAAVDDAAADNPDVLELRGDLANAEGRLDEARSLYKQALKQGPMSARAIKLAMVERRVGNPDAVSTLQAWLADHPDDVAVRLAVADARLSAQDLEAAQKEYEKIIQIVPENVVALNNLAWLLWQSGNVTAALPHIKTALELAPESPQVQDTAGSVFLAAGDAKRAVTLLRRAAEANPQDATIRYHLAQALHAVGESKQAYQILEQVLGDGEPFPERQQAEVFFKQLNG